MSSFNSSGPSMFHPNAEPPTSPEEFRAGFTDAEWAARKARAAEMESEVRVCGEVVERRRGGVVVWRKGQEDNQ